MTFVILKVKAVNMTKTVKNLYYNLYLNLSPLLCVIMAMVLVT